MSTRARTAGLAGETFTFDASGQLSCDGASISWSGGGTPATGSGARFRTVLADGGRHTITASCDGASVSFDVTVRPLDEWLDRARAFYGPALDLGPVTIKSSRLVLGAPRSGWTCNNVVRFKRARTIDDLPREPTLIHELAHVWQHQSGKVQLLQGFVEQVGRLLGRGDPYDYGGPEGVAAAGSLDELTLEGQAQVITEYWKSQNGYRNDRKGVPLDTPGYADDLRRLVEGAGIGERRRTSRTPAWLLDRAAALLVNVLLARLE